MQTLQVDKDYTEGKLRCILSGIKESFIENHFHPMKLLPRSFVCT